MNTNRDRAALEPTRAADSAIEPPRPAGCCAERAERSPGGGALTPPQWIERRFDQFTRQERDSTTILLFGLTRNHDQLLGSAIRSLGYRVQVLDVPDNESHTLGRAFCDRGMCNPTYYTVGHLLRFLRKLRDEEGVPTPTIIAHYLLVTPNGCGPCRFTLYINEYRKALRDAGFEGFRVLLFNQSLIDRQSGPEAGLQIDGRALFHIVRAVMLGDLLNLHLWRTRPYERTPGETEAAIARCREGLQAALERNRGVLAAVWRVRRELAGVAVDRTTVKPKVGIVGEIWAHTTEGEGNYRLQQFLEGEGAEVEPQTLIAWILLLQWEAVYDRSLRLGLADPQQAMRTVPAYRTWLTIWIVRSLVAFMHGSMVLFCWLAGLRGFRLPPWSRLARRAHPYYDATMRGGEMFAEVAKLLDYAERRDAHLVVSVKPFGCMPSSSVSDGVQSLVSHRCRGIDFLPLETTGDSAVNAYSRLQMQLFRARSTAQREAAAALAGAGMDAGQVRRYLERHPGLASALHRSPHRVACTAANLFAEVGARPAVRMRRLWRWLRSRWKPPRAADGAREGTD